MWNSELTSPGLVQWMRHQNWPKFLSVSGIKPRAMGPLPRPEVLAAAAAAAAATCRCSFALGPTLRRQLASKPLASVWTKIGWTPPNLKKHEARFPNPKDTNSKRAVEPAPGLGHPGHVELGRRAPDAMKSPDSRSFATATRWAWAIYEGH